MEKLIKDKRGAMYLTTLLLSIAVITIALFVTEFMRIYSIHQHLNDELYRATNIGVKSAMYDSYMWDKEGKMDEGAAVDAFYNYLNTELGLNAGLQKYEGGSLQYTLVINNMQVSKDLARMEVKATAFADPSFFITFGLKWEIPLHIVSRNMPLF